MATEIINSVRIGNLKSGNMVARTPSYNDMFRVNMKSIRAEWMLVGTEKAWVFKPEFREDVARWARQLYSAPVSAAEPVESREMSAKEQFAVAMGLGLIAQEDLS